MEPENEEGGVDPYSVRVRQALLDMRSPAQANAWSTAGLQRPLTFSTNSDFDVRLQKILN